MNDAVFMSAKRGDSSAIDSVMAATMVIVDKIVGSYYAKEKDRWFGKEDVAQEAIVDIYQHLDAGFKCETWEKFTRWVRTSAVHEVYNCVEKQQAKKRGSEAVFEILDDLEHQETPDIAASTKEEYSKILNLVAGIDEKHRDVFLMSVDGSQPKDIAEELGIPVVSVYRISREAKSKVAFSMEQAAMGVAAREIISQLATDDAMLMGMNSENELAGIRRDARQSKVTA